LRAGQVRQSRPAEKKTVTHLGHGQNITGAGYPCLLSAGVGHGGFDSYEFSPLAA
jgi:hypothetical protein